MSSSSENDENLDPSTTTYQKKKKRLKSALQVGPRKKPTRPDALVHTGRHFGRTINAMCNVHTLLTNAIVRETDLDYASIPVDKLSPELLLLFTRVFFPNSDSTFTFFRERRERRVYSDLVRLAPRLEDRIMTASTQELRMIGEALEKGANSARSDDTKSLKGAILDWIVPRGVALVPPIARNIKVDRGFNHDATGALLCPANLDWSDPAVKALLRNPEFIVPGDNWPILVYNNYRMDPSDAWIGLFRSKLLICAYKHIFTSPSSVEKESKATRSGNARIHGMQKVTIPSLAYVATQVRFALSSSMVFSRSDQVTDSERFYNSVVDFLEDPLENVEVNELLSFWNRQIFPEHAAPKRPLTKDSALDKLKARRLLRNSISSNL